MSKRLDIKSLSKESKERIKTVRAAYAHGENTSRITAQAMSRKEVAAAIIRLSPNKYQVLLASLAEAYDEALHEQSTRELADLAFESGLI